ncbi:processed acidic surface protein [Oceanobacillus piezotolerans]|uniref:processed acidic surface protein n=1 Tax=Oceanobacillus piezotolerans TaxID=2448030 RepID=UPI0013145615|nr:processed acidic surface protein [Oceanobacillus piezotolerans]
MKHKVVGLLFAIIISFSVLPNTALAVELDDPEFEAYLDEIGWEKEAYTEHLESKDWSLEEHFWSVDELGIPLTEESIQPVLDEFSLTREELNALLIEFGDIMEGQDVLDSEYLVFEEDLVYSIDYYINGMVEIDEENLKELLETYQFESEEELESFLKENEDTIDNYDYIGDLDLAIDMYLNPWEGTVIDDTSLQGILESYEFGSKEELDAFLEEHDDSIENYEYIEDLDVMIDMYLNPWEGTAIDDANLQETLDSYGFASKDDLETFLTEYDDSVENYEYIEDLDVAVDMYQNNDILLSEDLSVVGMNDYNIVYILLLLEVVYSLWVN